MMPIKSTDKTLSIIQSIEQSSLATSSGYSAILSALVSVIAAGWVIIAFFGSPGHFQPIFAVAGGGSIAVAVLALDSRLFRNPAMIIWLPPLFILAGGVGGTILVAGQAELDPLLLLGNVQVLGTVEAILRFALSLAVIAVLAISCSSPSWSHALAVFAISGPSLLLFFTLRSRLAANFSSVAAEKTQWFLFLGELMLIGGAAYLIFRWLLLERCHARLGQRAILRALKLTSPQSIDKALGLVDGWIDPFRLIEKTFCPHYSSSNRDTLTKAHRILTQRTTILNQRSRLWLKDIANTRPESLILLTEDHWTRKQDQYAINDLAELAQVILGSPQLLWISDTATQLFGDRAASNQDLADALQNLRKVAVITTLIMEVHEEQAFKNELHHFSSLPGTLPEKIRVKLNELTDFWQKVQMVLAEDDFGHSSPVEGFMRLTRILAAATPAAISWLPEIAIAAWARHSEANPDVQQTLWECSQAGSDDGVTAYQTLAILALEKGLMPELARSLGAPKKKEIVNVACDETFLLECDELCRGEPWTVMPHLNGALSELPADLVRRKFLKFLSGLHQAATGSKINRPDWFHREDNRPQLLEILEAPPTSIYGGRISCWTFCLLEGDQKFPVAFTTTGHGPAPVCARVSAALNALALDRDCPSDLILAGSSFFDLTASPRLLRSRPPTLDLTELTRRAQKLADNLGIMQILAEEGGLLGLLAGEDAKPTFYKTLESLAQVDTEMGFLDLQTVDMRCRDAVLEGLAAGRPIPSNEAFPVLLPYRVDGKPLQIKLPLLYLGAEEYEEVAEEYRRSSLAEIREEWVRRRQTHEEWCKGFADSYHRLSKKLALSDAEALKTTTTYIDYLLDDITLTRKLLDPPQPESEFDYLAELPLMILNELSYWARADYGLDSLPTESEFKPHWQQSLIWDAFLRNHSLHQDNARLDAKHEKWQQQWRPLALVALDEGLREQHKMTLADIALENTVFRVVDQDDTSLIVELSHIWDPHNDPVPKMQDGIMVFRSGFGGRRRTTISARDAQRQALDQLDWVLDGEQIDSFGLKQALMKDSGEALDRLVAQVCREFDRPNLSDELARVTALADQKLDPLVAFGLWEKLERMRTIPDVKKVSQEALQAGRKAGALPDFLAWGTYLAAYAAKEVLSHEAEGQPESRSLGARDRQALNYAFAAVGHMSIWQIVKELARPSADSSLKTTLAILEQGTLVTEVKNAYADLHAADQNYAAQCLASTGEPPSSEVLQTQQTECAPGCLYGWERICYKLAEGDTALGLAWILGKSRHLHGEAGLTELIKTASLYEIPRTYKDLNTQRKRLITDLVEFRKKSDHVTLELFVNPKIQTAFTDTLDIAENCYTLAALTDDQFGCGWLRLARLKWLRGQFRQAVSMLFGPTPEIYLRACQLPLAIAVRVAGGRLDFETVGLPGAWDGPENMTFSVSRDEQGELDLEILGIGRCLFSSLLPKDADLLAAFFSKYQPAMCRSRGHGSFEEWLRMLQIPSLGKRGALATAIQGDTESALLAACSYLHPPDILSLPPRAIPQKRPAHWLEQDVVTSLEWRL